ncbi:MAG TPA: hypothetical protein PLI22_06060 [Caldisericia bacterium]|nr:hypothetical protein [Caldisericia bacterium]
MKFSKFYATEAFTDKDMERASELIKSNLEKRLGVELYQQYGVNKFKNSEGIGQGIRYFIGDTDQAIRFNFNNNEISSVDIWDKNSDSVSPRVRLETEGESVIKLLPQIIQLIQNPSLKETIEVIDSQLDEQPEVIKKNMNVKSISNEVQIIDDKEDQKKLDQIEYADPDVVFDDMKKLLNLVITRKRNSIIISGLAGVGKSFTVEETLKESGLVKGRDFEIIKGKSTSYALYQSLFENRDKLIVYDDCDSILKNKDAINMLKAALDTNKERVISWKSKSTFNPDPLETIEIKKLIQKGKLPDHFDFRGRIIFITNIYYKNIDDALLSRSFVIDVTLKAKDVLLRIETILDNIMRDVPEATYDIKKQVLDYFKYLVKNNQLKKPMSIRTFIAGVIIRLSGDENWKRLVSRYA